MTKMPDKDPSLWALLLAWLSVHQPQIYAAAMAATVAVFRVIYGGGGRRQMITEGVLCGLIGTVLVPLLEWLSMWWGIPMPPNLATFFGCMVGFLGVEKLRDHADRFLGRQTGKV